MNYKRELISLIVDMSKTLRCCQQDAEFCEKITLNQFYILDLIAKEKQLKLSDLHELLAVEKSTTTRLVEPLVQLQLITREKSSEDSRALELKLTSGGERTHEIVWRHLEEFISSVEANIPEGRTDEVYEAVEMFLKAIKSACKTGSSNK